MRVVHIMGDGNPGGGPVVVETLCTGMLASGVEPVIVTQTGSYFFELARAKGWRTFGVDFSRRKDAFQVSREILALLEREAPDVVHAHGGRSALPISLMPRRKRPAFVYTVHGFHYDKKRAGSRQFFKLMEKLCIARADQIVVVGKADERFAHNEGLVGDPRRWSVVHNGLELPAGCTISQQPAFDVAFVGRLHPQKNPLALPAIMAAMKRPHVTMVIVGGGELEPALRDSCRKLGVDAQITLAGAKSRADALALMAQARIFVLPSLWEGVPISVVEAMKMGLPVVASRIPGNQELIREGETGLLASPLDPLEFATHIRSLLDTPDLARSLARNAASFASMTFSIDRQVSAYLRIYRDAIVQSGSSGAS
ncbi:glycosyltransferase family 4 protein [Bradyrhizobium jicamae]|uniref:Glycosyltransferase family 4 protein n=1 Tax=Bradyrhizobium jicamae TaxID=280332 RepID=A0ABS5FY25_9BRAD|nr:glycosyltransferase family 4 protein [Bradyrhizobium jicamae]MBR0801687.1 glycosyltransferase family 4 protein [Bradyrhizobium jicamae]